jgi:hypothetical protein
MVVNPPKISNVFNSSLLENVEKIASRKAQSTDDSHNTSDSLYLPGLTEEDLLYVIHTMNNKKSTRLSGISASVLKRCASYMIKPLLQIINA